MDINRRSVKIWLAAALMIFFVTGVANAASYPFAPNHGPPFNFTFGNHFDSHQQSRLLRNGDLLGFLYITNTGDSIGGIPVAEHCDENTAPSDCYVGWYFIGKPGKATFVFHDGDHPLWLVDRQDIPQPGAYAHFHWEGPPESAGGLSSAGQSEWDGYFLQLRAILTFYFKHGEETILVRPGLDIATHVNLVSSFPE